MNKVLFQTNINQLNKVREMLRIPATMSGTSVILGPQNKLKLEIARDHLLEAIKILEQIE
jgi:hypothetical protein